MKAQMDTAGGAGELTGRGGRGRLVGGLVLVGAGLTLLAGQIFTLGAWPMLILGAIFTLAGVTTSTAAWIIPGGVVNGIGLGALLSESALATSDSVEGGLFLLGFAAGWASIYLLSRLFLSAPLRWPLIPAGVMALIGAPLLYGAAGEALLGSVLGWTAYGWPLALIGAGLLVLARRPRK